MSLGPGRSARRLRTALAAAMLAGCGGAARPPDTGLTLRDGRGAGPDLALIAQPSGEQLHLSLWIDAGARAASPPQVSTLAAWLAAEVAGGDVRAEVLPDGIELATSCRKRELEACLRRLQRGISLRRPEPARLAAARERLVRARRAADAGDPARAADRLALEALYGSDQGAGLFPLGSPEDDAKVGIDRVAEFLARHFGPERALLVAVGAIDADSLAAASAAAFARTPRSTATRAQTRPLSEPASGVAAEVGDAPAVSLALAATTTAQAHAAANAFKRRLERDREALGLRGSVRGHVFQVRGAALALLRVPARATTEVVRSAAHELERLRREGLDTGDVTERAGSEPRDLARQLGARWTMHDALAGSPGLALGAGVLVAGGRADDLAQRDPDAALRDSAGEQLRAAFETGLARGHPRLQGDVGSDGAAATLESGARLAIRTRTDAPLAVAVRFTRGAASEPPTLHGRAALLATLTATACAGLTPEQLTERLGELGAELRPRVDADSWGITLTAPSARWQAALGLALDCALHPGLERKHLSSARLRLAERLGPEGGAGELEAAAAEQVWPGAPGALAPWGSPVRQASVSLAAVRELWLQSRRGPALSVAVVGAVPGEEAAAWAARRMAELEGGPAPAAKVAPPPAPVQTRVAIDQPTLGLAIWRVPSGAADPAGAEAFAALMRAALGQVPGVAAVWHGGGVISDGGWAAVGLSGAPEPLAGAVSALRAAARELPAATLARAADQAFALAERGQAAAQADPASAAEALAIAPFRPAAEARSLERARALATRLAQAEPQWLPLR